MGRKYSRSGKKKRSQYRKTAKEQEKMTTVITPEQRLQEKKRLRFNGVALGLLTAALLLMLGAPQFDRMGLPYHVSTLLAYVCSLIAGVLMLYSVKYAREEKKKTARITGGLMVGVGFIGLLTTLSPLLMG